MVDKGITPSLLRMMADALEKNEELQEENTKLKAKTSDTIAAQASGTSAAQDAQLTDMAKRNDDSMKSLKAKIPGAGDATSSTTRKTRGPSDWAYEVRDPATRSEPWIKKDNTTSSKSPKAIAPPPPSCSSGDTKSRGSPKSKAMKKINPSEAYKEWLYIDEEPRI